MDNEKIKKDIHSKKMFSSGYYSILALGKDSRKKIKEMSNT